MITENRRIVLTATLLVLVVLSSPIANAGTVEWSETQPGSDPEVAYATESDVAVFSDGNTIVGRDNSDGNQIWSRSIPLRIGDTLAYNPEDDALIASSADNAEIYYLNADDGSTIWTKTVDVSAWGATVDKDTGDIYASYGFEPRIVAELDPSDGSTIQSDSSTNSRGYYMDYDEINESLALQDSSSNEFRVFDPSLNQKWSVPTPDTGAQPVEMYDGQMFATSESGDWLRKYVDGTQQASTSAYNDIEMGERGSGYLYGITINGDANRLNTEDLSVEESESVPVSDTGEGPILDVGETSSNATYYIADSGGNNIKYRSNIDISQFVFDYSISGTVTDLNNNHIRDVTVSVQNEQGEEIRNVTTNSVGQYEVLVGNGTFTVTASKNDYRTVSHMVTVDAADVERDFQLSRFNQSIDVRTKRFIPHGQRADYRVIVENDTGRHNVTSEAILTSGNTDVVTVDTSALELVATTNLSINERTTVTAEWEDSEGNEYATTKNVTVANATVENLQILPTWTRVGASLDDETLQVIIVATMIGAGAALLASSFAGLSASTGIVVLGWFAGMTSDGVLIVSFLMAIFIGLNLAGNIDMQVSGG